MVKLNFRGFVMCNGLRCWHLDSFVDILTKSPLLGRFWRGILFQWLQEFTLILRQSRMADWCGVWAQRKLYPQMSYNDFVTYTEGSAIPEAKFIDDIEKLVGPRDPVVTLNVAKGVLSKYRYIENTMNAKLNTLLEKLPELKDALYTLERLKKKKETNDTSPLTTIFKVADTLYSEAEITSSDTAFLWLGANTLVEYPIAEAIVFLEEQHKSAQESIDSLKKELEWLRTQLTATEITVSRLHNFSVMKKTQAKAQAQTST